jgi:hypothetical protein
VAGGTVADSGSLFPALAAAYGVVMGAVVLGAVVLGAGWQWLRDHKTARYWRGGQFSPGGAIGRDIGADR